MTEQGKTVKVSRRTVDAAIAEALSQLGLTRDEVEVEVIKQGGRSLLGLLGGPAVVRVTAKGGLVAPVIEAPAAPVVSGEARVTSTASTQDEVARLGIETLQTLLGDMGIRAQVARESTPLKSQTGADSVLLNVSGDDLGVLIGRRGETLRDLQFITSLIISRRIQRWPSVVVDVEHYRFHRERNLVNLAQRMADKARATAEPVPLEPMPPHERRIVHLALRDDPDVMTESFGKADERKVVIMRRK